MPKLLRFLLYEDDPEVVSNGSTKFQLIAWDTDGVWPDAMDFVTADHTLRSSLVNSRTDRGFMISASSALSKLSTYRRSVSPSV